MKNEKKYINKLFIIQGILTLFVLFDYWRFFNRNIVGVAFFFFVLLTFFLICKPEYFVCGEGSLGLVKTIKNMLLSIVALAILISILDGKPVTSYDGAIGYITTGLFNPISLMNIFYCAAFLFLFFNLICGCSNKNNVDSSNQYFRLVCMKWRFNVLMLEAIVATIACLGTQITKHSLITLIFIFLMALFVAPCLYKLKKELDFYDLAYRLKQERKNLFVDK